MDKNRLLRDQGGFTLIEIIAVLVILSVLASMAVPRFFDLEANANERALDAAIGELNGRENMIWAQHKISIDGYDALTGDDDIWDKMKSDPGNTYPFLGEDYTWVGALNKSGGTLQFKQGVVQLVRGASTTTQPGKWQRITP